MRIRRILVLASAGLICVAVAACGSSKSSGSSSRVNLNAGIKFSDCMRANGIPNFPDPSSGGGIQIPNGVDPQSPAFQAAQNRCFKLMPGGGPLHGHASEQQKLMMLHLSQCMRAHGFPDFPDPVATPPNPGGGMGIAFGAAGSFIAVPQTMLQSPGFQQAASTCGFPGAGHLGKGNAKKSFTLG
ncbi:MAG TPA: hypothetical protein VMD09_06510 [Solirubrobacteraceae bacterium]|nr:hypothetical protein [Solirubrobacteraceae bacterium]